MIPKRGKVEQRELKWKLNSTSLKMSLPGERLMKGREQLKSLKHFSRNKLMELEPSVAKPKDTPPPPREQPAAAKKTQLQEAYEEAMEEAASEAACALKKRKVVLIAQEFMSRKKVAET
ncbi:hypothetical protein ACS0TY_010239 [Phlomoides rotata]